MNNWAVVLYHMELGKWLFLGIRSAEDARAMVFHFNRDTDTVRATILHESCVTESDRRNARIKNFAAREKRDESAKHQHETS